LKRLLLPSKSFVRSARRLVHKHPRLGPELQWTLELLAADAFHPRLKTHKLKGKLAGTWACSAGYDIRIVFDFVKHNRQDAIWTIDYIHADIYLLPRPTSNRRRVAGTCQTP
jgi:mRNA-degrading endonuclease YafQ of YafQ-DinJ toxin-antitoxin module